MIVTGTFDIECASWNKFAVAATYEPATGSAIHRSRAALVDHMIRAGGTWWSHAGGIYDLLAVSEEIRRRGLPCTVDLSGHRVSRIVCGKLTLRDSWSLVPLSLDAAAEMAGEVAPHLPFACSCGLACGGFCTIRPGDKRSGLADYCAADARVLYLVLQAVDEFAEREGIILKGTLGASAWATARDTLGLADADIAPPIWRAIRRAYFGGRVTIARPRESGPGVHYDISGAYPASLAACHLPDGEWRQLGSRAAMTALARQQPGVYDATVDVPRDTFMPALPVRLEDDRTTYPVGRISGTWVELELRSAVERGAKIIAVDSAIVWERTRQLFAPIISRWHRLRQAAGKKTAWGRWLRLVPNSLTGKLAERPDRRSVRMHPEEIKICEGRRPCTNLRCSGRCGAYEQLDIDGQIWSVPFYRPARSGHIHWAAYLTAHTRGVWLDGADRVGGALVYGDTDSIWLRGHRTPGKTGDALGAWEYKHGWTEWQCVAPKSYRFRDPSIGTVVRTAGLSITDDEWDQGFATSDRGVLGFVEAARTSRGLFRRAHRRFSLSSRAADTGLYGDRRLDPGTGVTYPPAYGEAKEEAIQRASAALASRGQAAREGQERRSAHR